jgi:hypothetical protein
MAFRSGPRAGDSDDGRLNLESRGAVRTAPREGREYSPGNSQTEGYVLDGHGCVCLFLCLCLCICICICICLHMYMYMYMYMCVYVILYILLILIVSAYIYQHICVDHGNSVSIGSVLYPQHKTANVISKVITGIMSFMETPEIPQTRTSQNAAVDASASRNRKDPKYVPSGYDSDLSIGSTSPMRATGGGGGVGGGHSMDAPSMSVEGAGGEGGGRSLVSSPSGRSRGNKNPTGRRQGKTAKQQGTEKSSVAKEKILYARKGNSMLSIVADDEHAMTIYSATGIDKGTNTDNESGIKMKDIEANLDDISAAGNSIISQISFPESIPPKNKFVLDATYAHFPEIGIPSSPYAKNRSHMPDPKIIKDLKESLNPLVTLYNEYWQFIPSVFRARLLSTAATRNEYVTSRDSLKLLFDAVLSEVEKLELSLNVCNKGLEHSAKLTQSLIVAGEKKKLTVPYQKALSQLLINIAEIEVSAVWADLQLVEYRDMFHKFHHMGIPNLTQMIKTCSSYRQSQLKFVACERISTSLLDRIMHIKAQWAHTLRTAPEHLFVSEADIQMRLNEYIETINNVTEDRQKLTSQLRYSQGQLQMAAQELLETQMQIDRTPNALLFYVTLLDPSILPSLHTIIGEMKDFKLFVTGEQHFDYTSVRRGLEACTTVLPYVERFLSRFADLKKKWVKDRVGKFTVLGLTGGDADATAVCPFCNVDNRMI